MNRHIGFRILSGLVLLAAIAGIAFFAYNAGVAHGTTVNVQAPGQPPSQALPWYGYGMPPFRAMHAFLPFGCFGLLMPLFLVFLAFAALRHIICGPRLGEHHGRFMHHMHEMWGEDGVPPMFAELHRRAHAQPADDATKK